MLTGDKMETAKCISISTGLLAKKDEIWLIDRVESAEALNQKFNQYLQTFTRNKSYYLLIDGMSLLQATKDENIQNFLSLAMKANCVCCCRCAPSQKREITSKLKSLNKRVLGIGDGGNDVGMIQEAHVGIGIEGKEGKQAALASDYSIREFQDVLKLVLWHGRMIYMTVSKMCNWVMHRGLIIAAIQFFFTIMFFFIDIPIFNGFLIFGYSTIFTSLPVISIIMDEDLDYHTVRSYPKLYRELQLGRLLNNKKFFLMLAKAVFQVPSVTHRREVLSY